MKKYKILVVASLVAMLFVGSVSIPKASATETTAIKDSKGANDDLMNDAMIRAMDANLDKVTNPTQKQWIEYLNTQFKAEIAKFEWTDTSKIPGISKWEIEDPRDTGKSNGGVAYMDNTTGGVQDPNVAKAEPWAKPIETVSDYKYTYDVYSAQQLKYALMQTTKGDSVFEPGKPGTTINLMVDLDLQGYQYTWSENNKVLNSDYYGKVASIYTGLTFNGMGHTIYNVGGNEYSFLGRLEQSAIKDLKIVSAKMVREKATTNISENNYGFFIQTNDPTSIEEEKASTIDNLTVKDSLFFCGGTIGGRAKISYLSPIGFARNTKISDYYTMNNALYGGSEVHVGGAIGRPDYSSVKSSFSVDSTIVSVYQHSGGFISCTDGALAISDCFTNNTVYGDKDTGVFIGATTNQNKRADLPDTKFERCYASGTIEGKTNLGGFIGASDAEAYGSGGNHRALTFIDCYSTSIVGMKSQGTNQGGFVGDLPSDSLSTITFKNCYAAGEVGSIDTDVSPGRTTFTTVGGFVGKKESPNATFENCYYDKQTTGMREWETGTSMDKAKNLVTGEMDVNGINDIEGIKGVLTSDSKKSGIGIASKPISGNEDGFKGFGEGTVDVGGSLVKLWIYDANVNGKDDGKHNCEYPQLSPFAKASSTEWGEYTDLVKAFSFASAATIHEQVWDNCLNEAHASLSAGTYDTIRDLTLRFTMTSYINTDDTLNIKWQKDNTKTTLYGESNTPVVGYLAETYNDTHDRDYYTCDEFAPGIEWLTVKITVNGVVGNRRLRVVPTTNIDSGDDKLDLFTGQKYDHALDVKFAKSTGPRLNENNTDITQGVYPDSPITDTDVRKGILKNIMVDKGSGVYEKDPNPGTVPASFAVDDDKFSGLKSNFMTGADGNMPGGHPNTYMSVRLYRLPDILPNGDDKVDVRILIKNATRIDLESPENAQWKNKLNGKEEFVTGDTGRYVIEYAWVLDDARYTNSYKMLLVQDSDHKVKVSVKDDKGNVNNESLRLYADTYNTDTGPTLADTDFTKKTTDSLTKKSIKSGSKVLFAAKKRAGDEELIKKIELDIYTPDGIVHQEIVNPTLGSEFSFNMTYFYGSYGSGGVYYVQQVTTKKTYTLAYNKEGGYYYVEFNNTFEKELADNEMLIRNDLNNDIDITITINKNEKLPPDTGDPDKPDTGDPDKPDAGEPDKPDAGDPGKPDTGDPDKPNPGDSENPNPTPDPIIKPDPSPTPDIGDNKKDENTTIDTGDRTDSISLAIGSMLGSITMILWILKRNR